MNTLTLAESNELYRQTHEKHNEYFAGFSIMDHIHEIGHLIQYSNIQTAIDYGCGKARAHKKFNFKGIWKLKELALYDPGVEEYSIKPTTPADLVICTDVMEHIPENLVDEVLADINALATKAIFFNIATTPASKRLVDGSNAHATVQRADWWQNKIDRIDKLVIVHYSK